MLPRPSKSSGPILLIGFTVIEFNDRE